MNQAATSRTARRALSLLAAAFLPLGSAQALSPLGWDIPAPGTSSRAPVTEVSIDPQGPTPLGFVIPPSGPRGAAGPMREDAMASAAAWSLRLGGIGGTDTN